MDLRATDITVRFGGVRAIEQVSMALAPAEILGLIGPNGAGKTTMFDLLSGFARPDSGTIRFAGREIADMAPHRIARLGLVRTFQLTRVMAGMSVMDNMLLAAPRQPGEHLLLLMQAPKRARAAESRARRAAEALLESFGLAPKASDYAGSLSGGQRKLLEIGRALMTEPSIVLLDEPMAGVNPSLADEIAAHLTALNRDGLTICLIEHDMALIRRLCDPVVVMAEGKTLTQGSFASVAADPRVQEAYLGRRH